MSTNTRLALGKLWTDFGRVPVVLLVTFFIFSCVLPWLAALTPPGVNMTLVAAIQRDAIANQCQGACDALSCPVGWRTALAPELPCKCVCKRIDPKLETAWDLEERARKEA